MKINGPSLLVLLGLLLLIYGPIGLVAIWILR